MKTKWKQFGDVKIEKAYLAVATSLKLNSFWGTPRFMKFGMAIQKQLKAGLDCNPMSNDSVYHKRTFTIALLFLTFLAIIAIWYPRFPAMQDYPESLFMAHVISSFDNSAFNWGEYYAKNLHVGPYSLFFVVVSFLAKAVPIEAAGKIFISLTLCLTTVLVFVWNRAHSPDHTAWSFLMLVPLLFSQVYYMGFVNYLISIPLLFLTLHVHEKMTAGDVSPRTMMVYLALLALLFLSHPYTVLVFLVLSVVISVFSSNTKKQLVIGLGGPLIAVAVFVLWFIKTFDIFTAQRMGAPSIRWWPLKDVFRYFLLPFIGMRVTNSPDIVTLLAWLTIVLLFFIAWLKQRKSVRFRLPFYIMLLLSIAGYIILPFWLGDYSYFNLRMSIICYFLLALVLSSIQLTKWSSYLFVLAITVIMLMTIRTQTALSAETERLLPLFDRMKKNEMVYFLDRDSSPSAIDTWYFYQFHSHENFYYHIVVGGGVASKLFDSKMNPILLKNSVTIPDIFAAPQFYQYVLVRGPLFQEWLFGGTHYLVAQSDPWRLYQRYKPLQNPRE